MGERAGTVDRPGPGGVVYEIHDYRAVSAGGAARPGDDATGVGWFAPVDLTRLPLTPGLLAALISWHVLDPGVEGLPGAAEALDGAEAGGVTGVTG